MSSRLIAANFASEFEQRVERAQMVRIASAWMTHSPALQALLDRKQNDSSVQMQAIIGIRGNATTPVSLEQLAGQFGWSSLKLANPTGLFHPKLYLFSYSRKPTLAWIGSANFTGNGMSVNKELVLEVDDNNVVATMLDWFRQQWAELNQDVEQEFEAYKADWREPDRYVGDIGGLGRGLNVRVQPAERPRHLREKLEGEIVYGPGDRVPYKSAADGLRKLLARLAYEREDEFLEACQATTTFQRGDQYYIVRRSTREEAIASGELYDPSRGVKAVPTLDGRRMWWMSGNSNNEDKWKMAKAAIDVANSHFSDHVVLADSSEVSWPDNTV